MAKTGTDIKVIKYLLILHSVLNDETAEKLNTSVNERKGNADTYLVHVLFLLYFYTG